MLIGFGAKGDGGEGDEGALTAIGCERVYLWTYRAEIGPELARALEFLRDGDTLAVLDLDRLEDDFGRLLLALERLHRSRIGLRVVAGDLVPGIVAADALVAAAAVLAEMSRRLSRPADSAGAAKRGRGRPLALAPGDRAKLRQLLIDKGATVAEVARVLQVSPATVYRYSPRRRKFVPKS